MRFPAEVVSGGCVVAPQVLHTGLVVAAVAAWVVGDDYALREPLLVVVGAVVALFGSCLSAGSTLGRERR